MTSSLQAAALALCEVVERECDATGPFGIVRATELLALCNAVRRAERAALAAPEPTSYEAACRALAEDSPDECGFHALAAPETTEDAPERETTDTLLSVMREATVWADGVFTQSTPQSIANHLCAEAKELADDPLDAEEIADCLLLLGHLINRTGIDAVAMMRAKLEKNRKREWGTPNAEGYVEHVKSAEPTLDRETLARAMVKRFQFDPQTSLGAADALIAEIQATREDRPS